MPAVNLESKAGRTPARLGLTGERYCFFFFFFSSPPLESADAGSGQGVKLS